ncbi:DUF72 domain-containing protein [Thiohalobacter sp. IOR34]|uniref:DUF72 domain-containing protein n=1 Tax=Thiohalobacter sp. IOR34 TaxID=3057176 RepID=UPI0025B06556|nr:DUF72 domain-containing protein [Thiohalobacter sp. IOR34]WJW74939.1 DUF72 domain-containing protein [Thiohalobacter sp. IOR34]
MARRGRLFVGTSGYCYPHWRGPVYPPELSQQDWFGYYSARLGTVEINNTFYRLPDGGVFEQWRRAAPAGFIYALKYSRYATHLKKLKDPAGPLETFLARAWRLGPHLGPVLVQLPPHWVPNLPRLAGFLDLLPADLRFVLELRDARWLGEALYKLLRDHGVALCIHDLLPRHPWVLTTGWTYLRYHGVDYSQSYSAQFLVAQARRIRGELEAGHDVYAYFNNDANGYAFHNALQLKRYLDEA